MKKQFVTYEIAKAVKELGFDEKCFAIFYKGILNNGHHVNYISDDWESIFYRNKTNSEANSIDIVSAPLWQQVIDWFRETHNKVITIYSNASGYLWESHDAIGGTQREWSDYSGPNDSGCWDNYCEAREHAILKAIELCQNKK